MYPTFPEPVCCPVHAKDAAPSKLKAYPDNIIFSLHIRVRAKERSSEDHATLYRPLSLQYMTSAAVERAVECFYS